MLQQIIYKIQDLVKLRQFLIVAVICKEIVLNKIRETLVILNKTKWKSHL
ncbi:hypothetical protein QY97_02616 [Bacillus thermotolerans]|uniref:Uncharacterized protein n=1 Tax=Bacillus thermotolerans TaxID=1221996 RepID=A0A0F5HNU4_BACTR|nr:hypothetical protein QY97_02616 [Bacillus thermotolerans]KKB35029.1 hypothetical protein QY95_03600 [Bacillus thermotolerans]KKB39965.1 hypothetical protein QY96_02534 [Bacillus thermotolerans]